MNTRSFTLNVMLAAILAVPLAAQAADTAITTDGWQQVGSETQVYVDPPADHVGKTRYEVRAELEAYRRNPVGADGWQQVGSETLLYVGAPAGTPGKTRAQVRAELIAHQAGDSISHDGWQQVGSETLLYVGKPPATAVAAGDAVPAVPTRTLAGPRSADEDVACVANCSSIGQ